MSCTLENEYVHSVYSRLASYQQKETRPSSPRLWPNVKKFIDLQPAGSCVVDIGCGEAKYHHPSCVVLGVDTCADVLSSVKKRENVQLLLGDATSLPFRDDSVDAVLLVSVLHHLSTVQRRKTVLAEAVRCLRNGGQMLICVWAYEQPNASFPSQDVLVPWKMHEQAINGRLPQVKFHMNSTKEQRIIEASIPITVASTSTDCNSWLSSIITKFNSIRPALPFLTPKATGSIPPATPKLLPASKTSLLSGIRRWSPMLSRRIASLLISVEEQFAIEITDKIMQDAVTETLATTRDVTFYRYYHVFRKGELEDLMSSIPSIRMVQSSFQHGNWCMIVEKRAENVFRP